MSTSQTGSQSRAGRPTLAESAEIESRLRHAALDEFLEHGFAGTTMESVARAAGTTKRTLYAHHPDKRTLFTNVVRWAMARQHWEPPAIDLSTDDLRGSLTAIARAAIARAVDPEHVRLSRMVATEAARFPELASSAPVSWSPRVQAVTEVLRHYQDRGVLHLEDVEIGAEQFLMLVTGIPSRLATFGVSRTAELEERYLQLAVSLFLDGTLVRSR